MKFLRLMPNSSGSTTLQKTSEHKIHGIPLHLASELWGHRNPSDVPNPFKFKDSLYIMATYGGSTHVGCIFAEVCIAYYVDRRGDMCWGSSRVHQIIMLIRTIGCSINRGVLVVFLHPLSGFFFFFLQLIQDFSILNEVMLSFHTLRWELDSAFHNIKAWARSLNSRWWRWPKRPLKPSLTFKELSIRGGSLMHEEVSYE